MSSLRQGSEMSLRQAIALLQVARDLIEQEARLQFDAGYRADLQDVAEDIGPLLGVLESFLS